MTAQIADELGRIPMSQRLGVTLRRATDYASAQQHAEVTLEHLLLALTEDVDAEGVLTSSGVPIASLKSDASQHIANLDQLASDGANDAISISADLRRILEAAAAAARGRRNAINGAIVLAAIVGDGSSAAAHILSAHGMTFEHAIRALQQVPSAAEQAPPAQPPQRQSAPSVSTPEPPHHQHAQPAPAPASDHAPRDPNSNDAILAEARERVKQRSTHGQAARRGPQTPEDQDEHASAAEQSVPAPPSPQPVVRDRNEPPTGQQIPPIGERTQPPPQIREQTAPPPQPPNHPAQPPSARPDQQAHAQPQGQPGNQPERQSESWAPPPAPPRGAPQPPRPYRPPPPISPEPSPQLQRRDRPEDLVSGQPHLSARQQGPHAPSGEARHHQPSAHPHPQGAHPGPPQQRPPGAPPWADSDAALPPQGAPPQHARQPAPNRPPAHDPRVAAGGQSPAPQRKRGKPGRVQPGQLAENIPRKMRVGITSTAEVRIAKADVKALAEGLEGGGAAYKHDLQITKAMSVRLRAPDGGFFIETASPETQWTENVLGMMADDYASWRWNITPKHRGRKRLQLVISARTMGSDGVTAETALPDQVFEVSVKTNYARTATRTGGWIAAAIVGGLLARFGEQMWDTAQVVARTLSGP